MGNLTINLPEPASGPQSTLMGVVGSSPRTARQRSAPSATVETVDCRDKSSDALRRELFGHISEGTTVPGAFERARAGTVVLEHLDALPRDVQQSVAATLGDHVYLRVGGRFPLRLKARVVATLSAEHASAEPASSVDACLLHRLQSITIEHEPQPAVVPPQAPVREASDAALRVGAEGQWMSVPGQQPADLRRRKNLRRILGALTRQHRIAPGEGIARCKLIEIGWPGERISPAAGTNRIYVALATLRKFGLRGLLMRHKGCYFLDPAVTVQRSHLGWDAISG